MPDHEPGLNQQREEGPALSESDIQAKIDLWRQSQPSRETLSSDKTNFTLSNPIDNQIQNGVDFFDDETSSHTGFVPKTDLASRYHQMRDATIAPAWPDAARSNEKTRNAYGANGEYAEVLGVGLSNPSHILENDVVGPAGENYPMSTWGNLLPIEASSMYRKDTGGYTFKKSGTIPPGNMDVDIYPSFDIQSQTTLYGIPKLPRDGGGLYSWINQKSVYSPSADTTDFMLTPISDFSLSSNSGFFERVTDTHTVLQINSTAAAKSILGVNNGNYTGISNVGPFGFNDTPLTYPLADGSVNGSLVQRWLSSQSSLGFTYEGDSPLGEFTLVPNGLNENNLFSDDTIRNVANKGPFEGKSLHPIIVTDFGNDFTSQQELGSFVNSEDIFGLETDLYKNMVALHYTRLQRWSESIAGITFIALQQRLQALNPTVESRGFRPESFIGNPSQLMYAHISRHPDADGANRYESVMKSSTLGSFAGGGGGDDEFVDGELVQIPATGPTLSGDLQKSREFGFGSRVAMQSNYNIAPELAVSIGFFGLTANFELGTENPDMANLIYFSNPNRYARALSSAPVSIENGIPSFTVATGTGPGSTAAADANKILETQGGTFKKDTHYFDGSRSNIAQKYATLAYGRLNSNFSYETQLETPADITGVQEGETFGIFPDASIEGEAFGGRLDFSATFGDNPRLKKKEIRGQEKKINDDIGTVKNASKLLGTSLEETVDPVLGVIRRSVTDTGGIPVGVTDAVDKINYTRYGDDDIVDGEDVYFNGDKSGLSTKDFIKFRFYDVINGKYIIFRAILSGISDQITTDYNEDKYIGRPDKLYTYRGADRSISFNFKVYPKTKQELPILMEKLNYLVGLCYPSLGNSGRMKSPFMQLTIGDMIAAQPGILRGLTVSVDDNSTWEIQQGLQFPKHINVSVQFTYIGRHLPIGTSSDFYGGLKPDDIRPKNFADILKAYVNLDIGTKGNTLVDGALELIGNNKKVTEATNAINKYGKKLGFKI